jgi:hypothetical protein
MSEHLSHCCNRKSGGVLPCSCVPISPVPWALHQSGSHVGIKDARGSFVVRKTVNLTDAAEFNQLIANLDWIVQSVNDRMARKFVLAARDNNGENS